MNITSIGGGFRSASLEIFKTIHDLIIKGTNIRLKQLCYFNMIDIKLQIAYVRDAGNVNVR